MPNYDEARELIQNVDFAAKRFKELCFSDFETRNHGHLSAEAQEAMDQNRAATAQLKETVAQLDDITYDQSSYIRDVERNAARQQYIKEDESSIKVLQAAHRGENRALLEQQRNEYAAQIDAAPAKRAALNKQIEFDQKNLDVSKKLIAAEKEQLSNDPEGVHQKAREEEIQEYNKWMEKRTQHEKEKQALEDSIPVLESSLEKTESALAPFHEIDKLIKEKANLEAHMKPLDESKYNERDALLRRTLDDLNKQALLPLKWCIEAGLKDLGYPPMDITGKNKNDVLVWDKKTKSLIPLADKALDYIDGTHRNNVNNVTIGRATTSFYGSRSNDQWRKIFDTLHIYPNENAIKPDIINFDMRKDYIFHVSTTPPEPPKEPTRGYQFLDKIARFFGGRNATCKRYDAAYDLFVQRVDDWNGPEGYREYMDKQADERAVKRPDEPVVKTVKSPEILKALVIARAKEVEAKQAMENMKEPQTAKVKAKSKAKSKSESVYKDV